MTLTRSLGVLLVVGFIGAGMLAGCEKGPAQKAGEKIDKAVDKLTGKGTAEKAGERLDDAVDALKKKYPAAVRRRIARCRTSDAGDRAGAARRAGPEAATRG